MSLLPKACYISLVSFYKLSQLICMCALSAFTWTDKITRTGNFLRHAISAKGVLHSISLVL